MQQFYGFAHLAFFMAMALVLSRLSAMSGRPFWLQAVGIIGTVLIVGGTIELIQPYFGRSATWRDLGIDGVGGLLGIMFLAPARLSLNRRLLACVQLTAMAFAEAFFYGPVTTLWDMWQASRQFPVLSDFETCLEAKRWSSGEIYNGIARHGERSLRVALGTEKYAGTTLKRSFGDWRGFSSFAFSVYNPDPEALRITVAPYLGGCGPHVANSRLAKRVIVLGIDGMDPHLLSRFVGQGIMPHFQRLIDQWDFRPVGTSLPPQSPVAWSTFIPGMNLPVTGLARNVFQGHDAFFYANLDAGCSGSLGKSPDLSLFSIRVFLWI